MSRRRPHNGSVGCGCVGAAFQTASGANQILGAHIFGVRIAAGLCHFAGDLNRAGLDTESVFVNQEAVAGLQQNVSAASHSVRSRDLR